MKRLHSKRSNRLARWLHRNLGLVAWYKYASEYGESYVRPVIMLVVVLAIFTLLLPLAGLNSSGNVPQRVAYITSRQAEPPSAPIEVY